MNFYVILFFILERMPKFIVCECGAKVRFTAIHEHRRSMNCKAISLLYRHQDPTAISDELQMKGFRTEKTRNSIKLIKKALKVTQPFYDKFAIKIQSLIRGYLVRKFTKQHLFMMKLMNPQQRLVYINT